MFITQIPIIFNWLKNVILLMGGLIAVIIFCLLMADSWEKYQSRDWPATNAQIDSAKIQIDDETNQGSMLVGYSYVVNGRLYTREITEKSSKKSPLSDETKQNWRSYLSGKDITVYYKPNTPKKSLIARERILLLKDFIWLALGAGLILLFGGIVCIYAGVEGFKEKSIKSKK